jgi:lactose/L-arabinose transport system permease protein
VLLRRPVTGGAVPRISPRRIVMGHAPKPSRRRFYDINGWSFVAPALLLIAVFMVYPIGKSLWMSVHSGQGTLVKFVGFGNAIRLASDPIFLRALSNTIIFLIIQVPIMIVLAMVLASLLNMPDLKARGFLRTAVFLPCVTSLVAYSVHCALSCLAGRNGGQ